VRALSAATLVVAVSGYAVIVVAGRALDTVSYEAFSVFWGLFFALAGLVDGLLQETARSVAARRSPSGRPLPAAASCARPMAVALGFAVVVGTLALASAPLWSSAVLPDARGLEMSGVLLMAGGLASYSFQAAVCGLLSAATRWSAFAWLISVDSAVRILLALVAWALGWHLLAFLLVTVVGAATWLGFVLLAPAQRDVLREVGDVPAAEFVRRTVKAMLASGANAVLITGFPVLISFTSGADVAPGALAAVITAVTLTRAPLLVPLQRFQPALIVHFTRHRDRVLRACVAPAAVIVGTAAVGGVAAYWLARPLMLFFFDADLVSPALVLALLTVASASTALLMVTGSAAHAAERHSLYLAGWAVATVAAVALLLVDASPEARAVLALGVAPLAGVVVHLGVLVLRPQLPTSPRSAATPLPRAGSSGRTR
jgi:O-antigen/teichoic acid export membrane protein